MEAALLVGTGAAFGAVLRYAVGEVLASERLPLATFVANLAGSVLLGLVVAAGVGTDGALLVGTGFCGALTTYSSFAVETVSLWEQGDHLRAAGYALGTLLACLTAAVLAGALIALAP